MMKHASSSRTQEQVSLTLNLVVSSSGQDANLMMSLEDLLARQRQTWATCPDWVQKMILKIIRETIKAKMEKEHGIQEDGLKGLLTIGKQRRQRCRVRCLDGPPTGNSSDSDTPNSPYSDTSNFTD